jgi:hypothetical protein
VIQHTRHVGARRPCPTGEHDAHLDDLHPARRRGDRCRRRCGSRGRPGERSQSAKDNVVTVTATDYAFQAPDSIAAGRTTFHLVNKGPDFHHIWLIKLEQGKTLKDLVEATKTPGPLPSGR